MTNSGKLLFILFFPLSALAQTVSSPYSIIGIGDIETSSFNRTSGLANTGISLRSGKSLYTINPASLSALDDHFFTFEVSARGKAVSYAGSNIDATNNRNSDFTFKKISAGVKAFKWWGTSVGLAPFSSVNYLFNVKKSIEGTSDFYNAQYDGNGGVNQVFWANGFQVSKHFSLGINASYLFGSLTQAENITDVTSASQIISTKNTYLHNPYISYGLQYYTAIGKKWNYALGVTYSNKTKLNANYTLDVTNNGTAIITNQALQDGTITLPTTYGVGMSLTKNKRVTYAADYKYQGWSAAGLDNLQSSMVNNQRYSAGIEWSNFKNISGYLYERYYLQAGAFYNNGYLKVNNQQISSYGVTIGGGVPAKGKLTFGGALEFGRRGTTANGLVQETYTQFTINISYRDLWYTGGRKFE